MNVEKSPPPLLGLSLAALASMARRSGLMYQVGSTVSSCRTRSKPSPDRDPMTEDDGLVGAAIEGRAPSSTPDCARRSMRQHGGLTRRLYAARLARAAPRGARPDSVHAARRVRHGCPPLCRAFATGRLGGGTSSPRRPGPKSR